MGNKFSRPGIRQQANGLLKDQKDLAERIQKLEQNFTRMLFQFQEKFDAVATNTDTLRDHLNALIEVTGFAAAVTERVRIAREKRAADQAQQEQAALEKGIADGWIYAVDAIKTNSLIVGKYVDDAGKDVPPGRVQLMFRILEPEFKGKLIDKTAGAEIPVSGGKFVVLAVYGVDVQKMREMELKLQAEAAGAAVAQAAAADQAAGGAQ